MCFKGTAEGEREKALEDVMNYVQKRIAEHEQTFDKNNLRDLVDRFLSTIPLEEDTMKKCKKNKQGPNPWLKGWMVIVKLYWSPVKEEFFKKI